MGIRAMAIMSEPSSRGAPLMSRIATRDFVGYRSDSSLRAGIDQACHGAGLRRRVACEVDTIADLVELVALGLGVSLLPPAAIRTAGGRALGLATDPPIPRDLMLVTPVDGEPTPAARAFIDLLNPELEQRLTERPQTDVGEGIAARVRPSTRRDTP